MHNTSTDYCLKELSCSDDYDIYNMLQTIGSNEFEFHNDVYGMSYSEYKKWLTMQYKWSKGLELPNGYVKQWIFWFYAFEKPVGIGKLREEITEQSRLYGGNIGYAISSTERGKGYGSILFNLLLKKASELNIKTIISTVEVCNVKSIKIQKNNGGKLIEQNEKRKYFQFNL